MRVASPNARPALRLLLLSLALVVAVPLLLWLGGIVTWHVRITLALRGWEKDPKIDNFTMWGSAYGPDGTSPLMRSAGCRALPYLIASLDKSANPDFLEG